MKAVQPLAIGLLDFGHVLNDGQGVRGHAGGKDAVEAESFDPRNKFILRRLDIVPGGTEFFLPFRIGVDAGAEFLLFLLLLVHQALVEQALVLPFSGFQRITNAKSHAQRLAGLFRPFGGITAEDVEPPMEALENQGKKFVALHFELGQRVQSRGRSGIAGDEHQIACRGALRIPLQIVRALDRLAIFVNAKKGHVEVVARIGEIIRVAAEERGLALRREDQPHIGVFLVAVKPVFAAMIERNDVGAQPGFLLTLPLDLRDVGLAGIQSFLIAHARLDGAGHVGRHIFHGHENV